MTSLTFWPPSLKIKYLPKNWEEEWQTFASITKLYCDSFRDDLVTDGKVSSDSQWRLGLKINLELL